MSTKHLTLLCGLWASFAVFSTALAADAPQISMKLGLWEITVQPQMSGMPQLTEQQLQNIPPDRRAQIMAAMQSGMGGSNPRVFKECMTPEKQARGFSAGRGNAANCQSTVVTNTSSELEVHSECPSSDGNASITMHFKSDGPNQVSGNVTSVITRAGKTMNVNATMKAQWLGASCGDIKDMQPVQGTSP